MALPTLSTLSSRATRVATRSEGQAEMEANLLSLGYSSTGRSSGNKFVEALGTTGSCLVAYYGGYGGFQVEAGSSRAQAELIDTLTKAGVRAVPASNGWNKATREEVLHETRVALGGKDNLAKALAVLIGAPASAIAAEPTAVKTTTAALVHALVVSEDEEILALQAKIEAVKARKADKAAKIAALKAELEALSADE